MIIFTDEFMKKIREDMKNHDCRDHGVIYKDGKLIEKCDFIFICKGKSKEVIKKSISTQLNTVINNTTKNLSKVTSETSTDISTEMVQEQKAKIDVSVGALNSTDLSNLNMSGKSRLSIDQSADIKAENEAIIKIVSDASAMQTLGNSMAADIINKTKQDAELKSQMDTTAKIAELTKNSGGPEGMLTKLADSAVAIVDSLTGKATDKEVDTTIQTTLNQTINNTVINETVIENKIKTAISNKMKQAAEATCSMNTSAANVIVGKDITLSDSANASLKQTVSITAFNKCLIDLNMGAAIVNEVMGSYKFTAHSDTDQTGKSEAEQTTVADVSTTVIQDSAIMDTIGKFFEMMDAIKWVILGIVGIIVIAIVMIIFKTTGSSSSSNSNSNNDDSDGDDGDDSDSNKKKESDNEENDDDDNDDNDDKKKKQTGGALFGIDKFYLYAGLISFSLYLYNRSIKLCGVFLVVLILYLLEKNNK
jgi:hypothetical protein